MNSTRRARRRSWGAAGTEYIVVALLVGLAAIGIWSRLGPSAKCRMQVALQKLSDSDKTVSCEDQGGDAAGGEGAAPAAFKPPTAGGGTGGSGNGASGSAGDGKGSGSGGDNGSGSGDPGAPKASDESCPGGVCTMPGNCFVAGTEVVTEDGPLPIEQVTVGMRVLARDQNGAAPTSVDWKPVVHTFAHQAHELVALTVGNDGAAETIEVTPTHLVYAKARGWVGAESLTPGVDSLVDAQGHDVAVLAASSHAADVTVYNFEVADYHTYYVGAHAFWVHNTCPHDNDYHCYYCGESESGNLTAPSYPVYAPTYHPTPAYNPPNIVYAAPSHEPSSYVPAPKPSGGGGYSGGDGTSSGKGSGKLTADEKQALKDYTISSNPYNGPLRNGDKLPKKDWQTVQNIDSALKNLPKTYGTFYRGVSANSRILHKKYITDDGFMSFTDDKKVATEFFDSPLKPMKKGDHPTLFIYEGKLPGIQQFAIKKYQWEKEFLMGRGAKLKVLDAYVDKNGVQIIKVGKEKSSKNDKKDKKDKKDKSKPKEIQIGYVKKGSTIKHDGKEWKAPENGQYYINVKGQLVLEH